MKFAIAKLLVSFRCQVKILEGQAEETVWGYGCNRWWWRWSGIGIGYRKEFGLPPWVECSRRECKQRVVEIKRWIRRMSRLTEVFWKFVPKSLSNIGKGAVTIQYNSRLLKISSWQKPQLRLHDIIYSDTNQLMFPHRRQSTANT